LQTITLIATHFKNAVLKNTAVFALGVFIGIILIFSSIIGLQSYLNQNESATKYQEQSRQDWLSNPDKNPHRMAHYGNYAFRKSEPLSIFELGMQPFFGNTIYLEAHKQNTVNFSDASLSNSSQRFGTISVAMVLQILLPLLLFFVGFNCIAFDRENGTLKIILAQGVRWQNLIIGKILGLVQVLLLVYIPTILLIFGIVLCVQKGSISTNTFLSFFFFVAFHLLYLLLVCVVTVLVSAVSKTSKKALISLIGIWLILTIILPRGTQALGSYLYPTPSKIAFNTVVENDVLKIGDSHNPNDLHFKTIKDSLLLVYKVDSVQKLPFNYAGFIMTEGEKISSRIYNTHLESLLKVYKKQNSFSQMVAVLNPYIAIKNLSMALSNTDYNSFINFQKQAEEYRYEMAQKMNGLQVKYISNNKPKPREKAHSIDKKHWQELHQFQYTQNGVFMVFKNEIHSVCSIFLWIVVLVFAIKKVSTNLKAI
jgi:ABC-2 type transport system permease protein